MSGLITEDWLRTSGFKWDDPFKQGKHWILWVSDAAATAETRMIDSECLGVELNQSGDSWHCWIRSDICGRYTRFIHVRHVRNCGEVVALIEALIGYKFNAADAMYGSLRHPVRAEAMRKYQDELHVRLAKGWGTRVESETNADPDKWEKLRP